MKPYLALQNIDIYSPTYEKDEIGSKKTTYAASQTYIQANVQPVKSDESVVGGRQSSIKYIKIYLDNAVSITEKDVILYNAVYYDIDSISTYSDTIFGHTKLICKQTRNI